MVGSLDTLAFWSLVSLILRVVAIICFIYILYLQLKQFKNKELYRQENRLKRLLTAFVFVIAVSNIPIMLLHFDRIRGIKASDGVTSVATVTNALAMVIIGALLVLIYQFRSDDIDDQ